MKNEELLGAASLPLPGNGIKSKETPAGLRADDAGVAALDYGQGGPWPEGAQPDLRAVLEDYLESKIAPRTRVEYRIALRDFLLATELRTLPEILGLKAAQVVRYRNGMQ